MNDTQKANREIGLRLKRERKKKGLTCQNVADTLGTTQQTANNYERASVSIPASYVERFCRAYKITIDKIMGAK